MFFLTRALEVNGMTLHDISLVYVGRDMAEALRKGKVDAVAAYPPNSTEIENAGIARQIFSSSRIPGEIVDVLALDEEVVRERPDDVAGMIRAFYRAVRYAQEHPEEAWQIMSARERVTPEEFQRRCNGHHAGAARRSAAVPRRGLEPDRASSLASRSC